jgi:prepilin-type N-terminal cleavage/methylation domain-containing protein
VNRRGVTLAECLVALVAGGIVLAALHALLLAASRARDRENAAREVRGALRTAAALLRADLQSLSAPAGDLLAVDDSALTARVVRGHGTVCAQTAPDRIVVDAARGTWLRAPDPARDVARVFLDGDPDDATDDAWWAVPLTATGTGACPDGTPGVTLTLSQVPPSPVTQGAPVRLLEIVEYRLYRDASGAWWLGTRTRSTAGWSVTSPVAGPLRATDGLAVTAFDAGGTPTTVPAAAATLAIALRSRSSRPIAKPGGVRIPVEDSLGLTVAVVP